MGLWRLIFSKFSGRAGSGKQVFDAEAESLLKEGEAHELAERIDEALKGYSEIIGRWPGDVQAYVRRGNLFLETGRVAEALADYEAALMINPVCAPAHYNKGNALYQGGRLEEAAEAFRQAIRAKPDFADAEYMLACVQEDLGFSESAIDSYRRALKIKPDYAEVHCNLGHLLTKLKRMEEAEMCFRSAIQFKPEMEKAHFDLAHVCVENGRLEEAVACFREAIRIQPGFVEALNDLGSALQGLGRCDEAIKYFRQAVYLKPDFPHSRSNVLFCLSHSNALRPDELFAEHRQFGEQFEGRYPGFSLSHKNDRNKKRCLRIGIVSGDFYLHAMANFIEPIVKCLAGSIGLELHAYYNNVIDDKVTERFKSYFKQWNQIFLLPDDVLVDVIRKDEIDILVDMGGHCAQNRLTCFALKPAPVQASWLGYLGTTGMKAMDYYFCDPYFLPADEFACQFTEKLVYLPVAGAFLPYERTPEVSDLPALKNGYITFGSFNRPSKLSDEVVSLWSALLLKVPGSRMLLGAMPNETEIQRITKIFKRHGVGDARLEFHKKIDIQRYLALYHEVDYCLDTFPFAGGHTLNTALWMGVPTLTIMGKTPAGRFGASLLKHVGLGDEFVAADFTDFVAKGVDWAARLHELREIRQGLRQKFRQSLLCRYDIAGAGFESAFRIMWERWCDGLPPESFSVDIGSRKDFLPQ